MPIEFVRIACLLALAACASAATCNNTVCSMNPPDSCMGYTYEYCFNATTSTGYNGQICYYSSDCASYTKTDGDFSVKLSGQPPNIIGMYYSLIKNAIRTAYNNFCTSGTNYKICCPGAVSWANMNTSLTAMANNSEVMILSSKGSSGETVLAIRLAPQQNSQVCSDVTYTTTAAATTSTTAGTTTAAGATTTAAGTTTTAAGATTTAAGTTTTAAGTTTTAAGATTTAAGTTTTAAGTTTTAAGTTTTAAGTTTTAAGTTTTAADTTTTAAATTTTTEAATTTTTEAATTTTTEAATTTTTEAATTTTEAATTTTEAATTSAARRRRAIDFASMLDESDDEDEPTLKRSRRSAITLSTSDLATISSSINIATVITSALSSQNVTVTVTVTTVGYSSSPANQVESSRFVVCATALMALVGFSLRRNL
ncbi:hypothetical protein BOX15_Mlig004047g2 [Macrostomum lignano]|uniref:Uncharacterized protein n=1 Tax=Macrostomum lignano TaxID=282301 RepID=A0A267FY76_9PLAT|nr:hypothetical protein BOX15_Mlig004047g2 [Macrostomum lignano]